MPMRHATILAALVIATTTLPATHAPAQDLVGDRPDFTESALAVPAGGWQIEAGATITTLDALDTTEIGEVLVRHGLKPGTELRLVLPSFVDVSHDGDQIDDVSGLGNAAIGLKQELARGDGSRPQVAMVGHVTLPVGDEDVASDDTAVDLALALEWELSPRVGLGMNVGGEAVFADDTETRQWASAALGLDLGAGFGAFVEGYTFTDGFDDFSSYVDAGLTYLIAPDWQVDARVGQGLGDVDDETFFGAGLVTRF
ncbi:hypothetical protein GF314_08630 [bacterium]|nr:hypothetical protein [bacterium]